MVQFVILSIIFSINKPFKCDNLIFLAHFNSILVHYDQKFVKWHHKVEKNVKIVIFDQFWRVCVKNWHENGKKIQKILKKIAIMNKNAKYHPNSIKNKRIMRRKRFFTLFFLGSTPQFIFSLYSIQIWPTLPPSLRYPNACPPKRWFSGDNHAFRLLKNK